MVGHYPTNKLIGRELIPHQKNLSTTHTKVRSYPVLDPVSQAYPEVQGRSPTCYSPVRHSSTPASWSLSVRLACVKHAASVRPEPGSNSPQKIVRHQSPKEPDTQQKKLPNKPTPTINEEKPGAGQNKHWHTIEFSHITTHTHPNKPSERNASPKKLTTNNNRKQTTSSQNYFTVTAR